MFHFALRNEIRDTAAAEPLDHRFLGFLFLFDYGRRGFGRLMPHASGGGLRRWVEYLYEYLYYSDYGQKPRFYCVERLGFDSCLRHHEIPKSPLSAGFLFPAIQSRGRSAGADDSERIGGSAGCNPPGSHALILPGRRIAVS